MPETIGWHRFNSDGDRIVSYSKTHYVEDRNSTVTLCGAGIPHYLFCDSEGYGGECKRCLAAKNKMEKS